MYEPTEEDLDFLNQVDSGYIGITKPRIKVNKLEDESDFVPYWHKDVLKDEHEVDLE